MKFKIGVDLAGYLLFWENCFIYTGGSVKVESLSNSLNSFSGAGSDISSPVLQGADFSVQIFFPCHLAVHLNGRATFDLKRQLERMRLSELT